MPRLPASSLGRAINRQSSRAPLAGVVLRVTGGTASIRLADSSVVEIAMPTGAAYATGAAVMVRWNERESPFITGGRDVGAAGAARVVELNISQDGDLAQTLGDGLVASDYFSAMMLNYFFNATPLPSAGAIYVALMSRINNKNDYAEITSASVGNIKRAAKSRNTTEFPLATSGREIANAIAVGAGASGAADSFLSSGTGFALDAGIEGWGIFDAASGGNFWFGAKFDPANGAVKRSVAAGNTFNIPVGGMRVRFNADALTDFEARNYLNVALNNMSFARAKYRAGLISDLDGGTPSLAAIPNLKTASINRDSTTFPAVSGKTIFCAVQVGGGAGGDDNSFLGSGAGLNVVSAANAAGVGIYEGDTGPLCWCIERKAGLLALAAGMNPYIPAGHLALKLS